ncbi:MAG: flagellar hook-length control protein FliK [Stenotrophomonas sp.]
MNLLSLGAAPTASGADNAGASPVSRKSTGKPGAFDTLMRAENAAATDGVSKRPAAKSAQPDTLDAEAPPGQREEAISQTHSDKDESATADVWPPLGLSAMVLPVPAPPTPAVAEAPLPGGNGNAAPVLPQLAAVTGIAAAAASMAASPSPAAASNPLEETPAIATDMPMQSVALPRDDADVAEPSPFNTLLQGLSTSAEIRGAVASSTPFTGSPTATPDLNSEGFDEAIGTRLSWLADQKIGHAHIRITPHEMGQVEVKLQLDGDRVHATFTSAHADVRHALESSLPRLREMLGEQGLELTHADVGQQSGSQERNDGGNQATAARAAEAGGVPGASDVGLSTRLLQQRGLIDAYA